MSKIIVPKDVVDLTPYSKWPFFFFGGPIRGGGDWQAKMFHTMDIHLHEDFVAAIPCRWDKSHALSPFFLHGEPMKKRQLNWERRYLRHAALEHVRGCMVFWIPLESTVNPRDDGAPYGRDTFQEIGEWRGQMMYKPRVRIVIGADPAFDPKGMDVMKRNFEEALGRDFPIYTSMRDTALAAIEMAKR